VSEVVDTIGRCSTKSIVPEIVDIDFLRLATPGSTWIFLEFPINSFFLVSTLITGCSAARKSRFTCWMYRN